MALNAELARLGVTGALRVAAIGTTMPTAMEAWPVGYADLGYISDDGVVEGRDEDRQEFISWQSTSPIRTEITKSVVTFQATLWETNWHTVSLYYKVEEDDVTVSGVGDAAVLIFDEKGKPRRDLRSFGIDVIDGVYARRMLAPFAEVTERGDITYKSDTLIGYEVTITCYQGPDGISVRRMFREGWELPA